MSLRFTIGAAAFWALLVPVSSASQGLEEVKACVRANFPTKSIVEAVTLRSFDRTGSERTLSGTLYGRKDKKGLSRILIRIEAPPDVRGCAYLIIEREGGEDMFVYLPELEKVRRLHPRTASGSLFGTDFSYEDVRYLQTVAGESPTQRLPDSRLEERQVFVVETLPPPEEGSAYERIVSFIDRERCVPLKIEFYEPGGRLRKILTADPQTVERQHGLWVARSLTLKDLENETETRLIVEEIEIDPNLPSRLFSVGSLERGR